MSDPPGRYAAPVTLRGRYAGNRILSNSIYNNGDASPANGEEVGIDLFFDNNPARVTENDPPEDNDADAGPNNLQNFPDLTAARARLRVTTIRGTLNSSADTSFTIQFFSSPAADPTGNGEGKKFLGEISSVTTDGIGDDPFTFKTENKVPAGRVVTATATNLTTGDTSEFSDAVTVS